MANNESRDESNPREFKLKPGDQVWVQRGSGEFESSWYVARFIEGGLKVEVSKDKEDLTKIVTMEELRQWQKEHK